MFVLFINLLLPPVSSTLFFLCFFIRPGPIEEFSTATKGREHTSSPVEQKKHTEKSQEEEEIEEASEMAAEYAAALAGFTGAERIVHRASKQQPRSVTEAIQAAPDETIEPEAVSAPATETDHLKETGGEVLVQRPAPVVATRAEVPEESKQLKNMSIAAAAVEEMGRKEQEGIGTSALPVVMPIRVQAERISSQPFLKAVEAPSHETAAPEEVEKLEEEKESAAAAAVPLKKSEAVHPSKIPLHKDTHPSAIPLATTLAIAEAAAKEKEKEKEHAAVAAPIIEEVEEEHLPTTPTTPTTAVLVIEEEVFITESASLMTGVVRRSHEASPPAKLPPIAAAPAPAPAPRVQHPTETEEITTSEATTPSSSVSTSGSTPTKQQQKQQKQKKGRGRIRGPLHKIAKEIRKAVQSPVD